MSTAAFMTIHGLGAASGVAAASARCLVADGAHMLVVDVPSEALLASCDEIGAEPPCTTLPIRRVVRRRGT